MKFNIIEDNLNLTDKDKKLVDKKVMEKLDKYLQDFSEDIKNANVRVKKINRTGEYKVNFDMWLPGKEHIYADEINHEYETALTSLRNQVERQIKEYKAELSS
ncbi:hypothetical protein GF362_04025 [Candidatus Dojkabacteria bacterium]|nr:hypothetical protein [Candidatus Dojkabacteria bacterium]